MDAVPGVDSNEELKNYDFHEIKIENGMEELFGTEDVHMGGPVEPATESSVISENGNVNENLAGDEGVIKMDIKEEVTDDSGYDSKMQHEDTIPGIGGPKVSGIYDVCGVKEESIEEKPLWTEDGRVAPLAIKTESSMIIKYENSSEEVPEDEDITGMNFEEDSMMEEPGVAVQREDDSWLKVENDDIANENVKREETEGTENTQPEAGEKPFACEVCDFRFAGASNLKRHMRVHTGEKPFTCDFCDYRCARAGSLKDHVRVHTGEKQFACDICACRFRQAVHLKSHMRIHTGEKPFTCDICACRFRQKVHLKNHMRIHTGEKHFACDVCDFSCTSVVSLRRHMRVHTGEKPFACDVCDYRCARAGSLKDHMMVHTGEKPSACDVCDFSCASVGSLRRHMRVHTGEKPYACDVCDYRCARAGDLTRHMKVHTGEKPFTCDVCDFSCARAANLRRHMSIHT